MQTRIGLRSVRKSVNDIKHGAPQAVSPFHPPVKLNEEPPLKQKSVEEKTPKRQSSRLSKTGQRTLHDFTQLETTRSTAKSNGKKRAATTGTTTEHKTKKQRVLDFAVKPNKPETNEQPVEEETIQTEEPVVEHVAKKQRVTVVQHEEAVIAQGDEQQTEESRPILPADELKAEPVHKESPRSNEPVAESTQEVQLESKRELDAQVAAPEPAEVEPAEVESARSREEKVAPWKRAIFVESDEARLQEEKTTLTKLRNDLDITIMFQTANNRIPMFHKIQPMLRNSTKKNITISHVAKILYLAPILYRVLPKELPVSGKMIETYSVELGTGWKVPLSGKQLEERKNLLADTMERYFVENKGKLAIPEAELPKIEKIVDKEKWLKTANIPSGMRDLLQLEERRKEEADKAKETLPPITGTGSAKDRRKALMDRIRAKSKK